jgi:hypothetical protein
MEMVTIPLSAIQESISYFEKAVADYTESGWTEMAKWAEGRVSAYKSLLEVWHTA